MQKRFRLQNKIVCVLMCIFLVSAVFGGCGQEKIPDVSVNSETVQGPVSMDPAPVLEYEVPVLMPGVLIDRIGSVSYTHLTLPTMAVV